MAGAHRRRRDGPCRDRAYDPARASECADQPVGWRDVLFRVAVSRDFGEAGVTDGERLDWLEMAAKKSSTGISFDWVPSVEGEPSGFRFMCRFFIGPAKITIRSAI